MRLLHTLSFLTLLSFSATADGIEFFHGTWPEALARAEAEDKLLFVDAYASWCGPCKRMAANVFPLKEVGDFYNANFINVKFDMEKEESIEFRKNHTVGAFPTLLYINAKNEVVHKSVGGKQAQSLISVGNAALAKADNVEDLARRWEAGERDAKLAYKYVRALVRKEDNYKRIANDYLREPTGAITDEYNLRLIAVAATATDSRIFDLLRKYEKEMIALDGEEAYRLLVENAVNRTIDKSIEFRDEKLRSGALKKLAGYDKATAKRFGVVADYRVALAGTDIKAVSKATAKYLDRVATGNAKELREAFATLSGSKFAANAEIIELAARAGREAAQLDPAMGWRDYYSVARYLKKYDRLEAALEAARLSLQNVPADKANYKRAVEALLQEIETAR